MAATMTSRSTSSRQQSPMQRMPSYRSTSFRYEKDGTPDNVAEARSAMAEFAQDPVFSRFLSDEFSSTQFASDALKTGSATASAEKLEDGIQLLEKQLRHEVVLRHGELVQQLSSLKDMEGVLGVVKGGVGNLQASVRRMRSEISDPIKIKSKQLLSLHECIQLLRAIVRVLKQLKRLKDLMEGGGARADLSKAAQLYCEIDNLRKEGDLSGVEIVDSELPWLLETGKRIRNEAMKSLESGLEALNQAEVGSALQVYYNMGELRTTVENVVHKYKSQAVKSISTAFDLKTISANSSSYSASIAPGGIHRSGTPQLGGGSRAVEGLWQRIGNCIDDLHSIVIAVWHLQRVMSKKRDPISHTVFLDEVVQAGDSLLTERIWESIVKALSSQMKAAFTASSFVKEVLVLGYPKVVGIFGNLADRLLRDSDVKGVAAAAIVSKNREEVIECFEAFEKAYLARTLARLTEQVNGIFPALRHENILRLITRIKEEVEAVKLDNRLLLLVFKEVSKALHLLAQKAEYQVVTGGEWLQVNTGATGVQVKNMGVCVEMEEVEERMKEWKGIKVVGVALAAVRSVAVDVIRPLFKAMSESLDKSIMKLHEQEYSYFATEDADVDLSDDVRAEYMQEVYTSAVHFRKEFMSRLRGRLGLRFSRRMAARVIEMFVRHCAMVSRLSEVGKLRMARDMAEIEMIVGQYLHPAEELGSSYRALRAMRRLMFVETSEIRCDDDDDGGGGGVLDELPLSAVLHHLFSRSPPQLSQRSPFHNNTTAYSVWMDSISSVRHSQDEEDEEEDDDVEEVKEDEEQVWKNVRKSVDEYAAATSPPYHPVYHLILNLGPYLINKHH